jgi:hypothetical protein
MAKFKKLGSWNQTSTSILLSDPGYQKDSCTGPLGISQKIAEVKPGEWTATVLYDTEYRRPKALVGHHKDLKRSQARWGRKQKGWVAVDSGQLGIFDFDRYPSNVDEAETEETESFFDRACSSTDLKDQGAIMIEGAVSRSGFGDGIYNFYLWEKDNQVVGAKIVFITKKEKERWERLIHRERLCHPVEDRFYHYEEDSAQQPVLANIVSNRVLDTLLRVGEDAAGIHGEDLIQGADASAVHEDTSDHT